MRPKTNRLDLDKEWVMSKKFAGKGAVVTGGSTGIGLAAAKRFAQEGIDHVFITGRRKDALDAAVVEIGKNVTAVQGDVGSLSDSTGYMMQSSSTIARLTLSSPMPVWRSWPRLALWMRNFLTFTSTQTSKDSSSPCRRPPSDEGRRIRHPDWIDCRYQRLSRHECVQRHEGSRSFVCPDLDQ
jgi:hypothetical protein